MAATPRRPAHRPPGSKTKHRLDGIFKKCRCRKWSKCGCPWHLGFQYNGKSHRHSLNKWAGKPAGYHMAQSEAERLRDKLRDQIRDGVAATTAKVAAGQAFTLREVCDKYHEHCSTDPNRRVHRLPILKQALNVLCRTQIDGAAFGDKPVERISTADLEKFRGARRAIFRAEAARLATRRAKLAAGDADARKQAVSPELPHAKNGETGINRSLELLRKLFNWCVEPAQGYRTSESPFMKHGRSCFKFTSEQGRRRRLQADEEQRLLAAAPPHLQAIITAVLETGMRREEALSLQWRDVVLNAKGQSRAISLRAENTKTAKPRTIPVSARLRSQLDMRRNSADGEPFGPEAYVFGNEIGEKFDSVKTSWRTTCRKAGIEDLHLHDCRTEYASRLLEGGVALLTVSYLLGHAQISTTNSYAAGSDVIAERELLVFQRRQLVARRAASKALAKGQPQARAKVRRLPQARVH
jgi:integrase